MPRLHLFIKGMNNDKLIITQRVNPPSLNMHIACEQALPLKGLVTNQEKKSLQRSHSFFSILRSESERKLLIGQFV